MIQEILAISLFSIALIYSVFQLGKFFIPSKKNHHGNCGSNDCGCK